MLHVLISEGTYDKDFVAKYTVGFDDVATAVKDYTPEWAAVQDRDSGLDDPTDRARVRARLAARLRAP